MERLNEGGAIFTGDELLAISSITNFIHRNTRNNSPLHALAGELFVSAGETYQRHKLNPAEATFRVGERDLHLLAKIARRSDFGATVYTDELPDSVRQAINTIRAVNP